MADGDDIQAQIPDTAGGPPGMPPGGGGAPDQPPGPPGPPQGGGPILAALARRQMTPQASAPGMGSMAQGLMALKTAVDMIQNALPMLPAGSQQHRDALQAVTRLSRHLPQGTPTAGAQQTSIMDLLRGISRNAILQKLIAQQGGQGGQGAGPMPGGMPSPPQPSTPLPGA